jgi:hypothetical protein
MSRYLSAAVVAGLVLAYVSPARASTDFGYVYTAETEEPGETELSLWATDRRGKAEGHYDAQDYRLEVEHGFNERFQISGYVNLASHHVHGLGGEFVPVHRNLGFQGLSTEFKYKLLDPSHDRFGLAFYAEPGWSRIEKVNGEKAREFELEFKTIVQKNFLHDLLVWAANLTLEPEWEREHETLASGAVDAETRKELALEIASGVSYRLARKWWLGVEGRYHSVYPDWTHGLHRENYAVYAGPTVHYDAGEWSVTATWQPQLFGSPSRPGSSLELDDHEKRELRLKISKEF